MRASVVRIMTVLAVFSFGLIYTRQANAQQENKAVTTIGLYHLVLCENKTTNIIFPYAIKSVDRGSGDVIAQIVRDFGNVLQLKAGTTDFKQTNVTVITSDGTFYSFLVDYNNDPKELNISFVSEPQKYENNDRQSVALSDDKDNDAVLNADAASILSSKSFLHKHTIYEQMKLRLAGIYLKDNLMWFKLRIGNRAHVDFNIDDITFSVTDKKQMKLTARQELQLQPVYTKSVESIKGNTTKEIVLAFMPFTLSNSKRLKIQINEKADGRNLILLIKAKMLLRAKLL